MEEEQNNNNNVGGMTDAHRALVQVFMARKMLPETELQNVFRTILSKYNAQGDLEQYIGVINSNLHSVFFEVRRGVSEDDGTVYWGVANAKSDQSSQMATSYTLPEITLFKRIVQSLVEEDANSRNPGEIRAMDAINLAEGLQGLTLTKAEHVLKQMAKEGWLVELTQNGRESFSLGVRSFMELKPWLEELSQDSTLLADCTLCSELVLRVCMVKNVTYVKGVKCSNRNCKTKMHKSCSTRWFRGKNVKKCPTCTNEWPSV